MPLTDTAVRKAKPKHHYGRAVAGTILLIYAVLLVIQAQSDYAAAWNYRLVPSKSPPFSDLRNITTAVSCWRNGIDPLVENPCDPWDRPMSYPRAWLYLGSALQVYPDDTTTMGIVLVVAFLFSVLCLMGPSRLGEGALYVLLLCSPAVLLAVERGNSDLIVFVLLAASILVLRRGGAFRRAAYALIAICSVLKLYPIFALVIAQRERPRTCAMILAVGAALFAVYLYLIRGDLRLIDTTLPRGAAFAYGSQVFFATLRTGQLSAAPKLLATIAVITSFIIAYVIYRRMSTPNLSPENIQSFMVGAALYIATFAFGTNWNYRLIFLIFVVPALLQLTRSSGRNATFARWLLTTMGVSLWLSPFFENEFFLMKETANWVLFTGLSVLVFRLLPTWLLHPSLLWKPHISLKPN